MSTKAKERFLINYAILRGLLQMHGYSMADLRDRLKLKNYRNLGYRYEHGFEAAEIAVIKKMVPEIEKYLK